MKKYIFSQQYEDDIENGEYSNLISCCCKYSKCLSFDYFWCDALKKPDNPPVEKILKHEIRDFEKMLTDEAKINWSKAFVDRYSQTTPKIVRKYFEINEDTKNFVLSFGNLFSYWSDAVWNMRGDPLKSYNHEPAQNLIFYRSDKSVFFLSETHEGYCFLYSNDNEDVSDIVDKPGWRECN